MTARYAILLDGGFVRKRLGYKLRRPPRPLDVVEECKRIQARTEFTGLTLLRTYWYDAPSRRWSS